MSATMTYGDELREDWPDWVAAEFERDGQNGCVGTKLLSETDRVRVWEIRLQPGERIGFHRHVLDYFWTAITPGRARSHMEGGRTMERDYSAGETQHESYGPGQFKVHDLQNMSSAEMIFSTVEFKQGANEPISVPDSVRLR